METPTYEEALSAAGCGGRPPKVQLALSAMLPGDVIAAESVSGTENVSSVVSNASKAIGLRGHFVVRTLDGVKYVVRLKPEDMRK